MSLSEQKILRVYDNIGRNLIKTGFFEISQLREKVFTDFGKSGHVKRSVNAGIAIGIGIVAITLAIVVLSDQNAGTMEVEDTMDKELRPNEEVTPDIQNKLDQIEKTANENNYTPAPREWITSGPFQIDRSKYVLGEKVFLVIGGLEYQEKGQIVFLRPLNDTHYSVYQTIPFDGAKKNVFNYYIEPKLSKKAGICTSDDIVGNWTVMFRGTDYPDLKFEITNKVLPGDESDFEPVC